MSKPVSNADVEDVLASIRRLVSEEHRPFRTAITPREDAAPVRSDEETFSREGRLVLTPSLRVTAWEDAQEMPEAGDVNLPEQAEEGQSREDSAPGPLRLDESARVSQDAVLDLEGTEHGLPDRSPAPNQECEPTTSRSSSTLPAAADEATPERRPPANIAFPAAMTAPGVPEDDRSDGTQAPQIVPSASASDATVDANAAPLLLENGDRSDLELSAATTAQAAVAGQEPLLSGGLEEGLLRDLVSELVRQELNGELGERITRNVRKLVRREIQRALASRDFD